MLNSGLAHVGEFYMLGRHIHMLAEFLACTGLVNSALAEFIAIPGSCRCSSSCTHGASSSAALLLLLHQLNSLGHKHLWRHRRWHRLLVSRQSDRRDWLHRRQMLSDGEGGRRRARGSICGSRWWDPKRWALRDLRVQHPPLLFSRSSFLRASTTALCKST